MEPTTHAITQGAFSPISLNPYILVPICLAVAALFVSYLRNYQWPAQKIKEQLSLVIGQIKAVKVEPGLSFDVLEGRLYGIFEMSPFSGLWTEYRHSLHAVQAEDGAADVKSVLATVPAETFFSKETIVDFRINADFYRHLPGILTGIGIIGTFSGLVWGLHQFKPDPAQSLESLPLLLQEVTSAFIGSGLAILAAIFITYKEKSILNACYRLVEELNREIDSLYASGAGEAYLARLVRASERQAIAHHEQNRELSAQIAAAVKSALAEPMTQLSAAVRAAANDRQEAVGGLLENVLTGFMAKFDRSFGQQIQGINLSLRNSSETVGKVQDAMTRSIGDISHAGISAADRMSGNLEVSLSRMAGAQEQMGLRMIEQQKQFSESLDVAMRAVMTRLHSTLGSLALERSQQMEQDRQRHESLLAAAGALYSGLSANVDRLVENIQAAADQTGENIAAVQSAAVEAVSGMKDGAAALREAAGTFTIAGSSMSGLTDGMAQTAAAVRQSFEEYDRARETVQHYVTQLQGMMETVKKEAGVGQNLVSDMERIVGALAGVERQSQEYLERINAVLKQSFQDFGLEMVAQVRNVGAETNRQLGTSLNALSGTVDQMVSSVTKLRRAG
jgi:hypothetical protein